MDRLLLPPFPWAALIVWLIYVLYFFANPYSPVWKGTLSDPDDYLYLVQSIDWLHGQSWFDPIQHRMDPPRGSYSHFSHLLSGFYALLMCLFRPFYSLQLSALIVAFLIPAFYFALFLFAIHWLTRKMVDDKWGNVSAALVIFMPPLLSQYLPGHLDHHGLEVLIAVTTFCFISRMLTEPEVLRWAAAAGFAMALGLMIGLEIIAFEELLCFSLGIWSLVEGKSASRSSAVFASTFFISSLLFLLVTRSSYYLWQLDIVSYSLVYVLLTAGIAFCFIATAFADYFSFSLRYSVGFLSGLLTLGLFLYFFPSLAKGPLNAIDPVIAQMIYKAEPESWPLFRDPSSWGMGIMYVTLPLISIACGISLFMKTDDRPKRWLWGMITLIITVCLGLSAFYQDRFMNYTLPFSALPLAAMIKGDWLKQRTRVGLIPFWPCLRLAIILFVGPLTMQAAGNLNEQTTALKSSNDEVSQKGCDMHTLAAKLNEVPGYGSEPHLIINTLNEGTELMFLTPHSVLTGPFHTDIDGNKDALLFFSTSDQNEALHIAEKRHADFVVICNVPQQLIAYKNGANTLDGTFVSKLIHNQSPPWLTQIKGIDMGDLILFEIHLPQN